MARLQLQERELGVPVELERSGPVVGVLKLKELLPRHAAWQG